MNWFRLYHDVLNDAKIQRLPVELRWRWVELLCVASRQKVRGTLPGLDEIAYYFRTSLVRAEVIVRDLIDAGLIDQDKATKALTMHNWQGRQRKSDSSAERVAAFRDRHGNSLDNGLVTLQKQSLACGGAGGRAPSPSPSVSDLGREEGMQGEREGDAPLRPAPDDLGPEYTTLGEWAIRLGDDISWGRWVLQQGRCGHSVRDIRAALEECAGSGKLSQAYAAGKLRGWAADGGRPVRKGENNGRTAVQQRPEETRAPVKPPDFDSLPDTPENRAVRAMYQKGRAS